MTETDGAVTNLIERYSTIVADDDYERFGELLTEDCSLTLMPIGHTWTGRDNVMSAVMAAGSRRTHDSQSKVKVTNWFASNEYLVVEYEHGALVGGVRVNIDGYCWVSTSATGALIRCVNTSIPAARVQACC
jgi:hypothetical protein